MHNSERYRLCSELAALPTNMPTSGGDSHASRGGTGINSDTNKQPAAVRLNFFLSCLTKTLKSSLSPQVFYSEQNYNIPASLQGKNNYLKFKSKLDHGFKMLYQDVTMPVFIDSLHPLSVIF